MVWAYTTQALRNVCT
uniref:Uncharacterized protein n=1 Tax=Arundo donax TaxID=35708 RepID=A0A0A9ESU1_ARUDO